MSTKTKKRASNGASSSAPRRQSFAEKQLEEQNRLLREQVSQLQDAVLELQAPPPLNEAAPAPQSKKWEFGMQEREFGRLEGKADAYAMVVNDLLHLLEKVVHVECE